MLVLTRTRRIRPQSRESLVEKRLRRDEEMAAELDTLHSLETAFNGAITVNIEVGEEIYRPGGIAGAVPLYHEEKPRGAFGNYQMV